MFFILVIFFILFTLGYAAFAWAVIYHFQEYAIPGHRGPTIITMVFAAFSGVAWIYALISLLAIGFWNSTG